MGTRGVRPGGGHWSAAPATKGSDPAPQAAVVRRFYEELWNEWQLEIADELLAPGITFRGTLGTSVVGIDGFRDYAAAVRAAFPDWHNEIEELIASGESVAARITCSGTHEGELLGIAPTGRRVSYPAVGIFHVNDGLITNGWVVGDTQQLWAVLGELPPLRDQPGF